MLIYLLAFVGGVLTILSPCILPVLPFVFAHADRPFRRAGLPLLLGMALTFSLVATAAAYGGHWVVRLNQGGRYVAMARLPDPRPDPAFSGTSRGRHAATRPRRQPPARRPVVARAKHYQILRTRNFHRPAVGSLRRPHPRPHLNRSRHPRPRRALLILAIILRAWRSHFARHRALRRKEGLLHHEKFSALRYLDPPHSRCCRNPRSNVAIALGWDTNLLAKFSVVNTATPKNISSTRSVHPKPAAALAPINSAEPTPPLADEGPMPELTGAVAWLNSPPLTRDQLRGKVVVIDFWTYSCINCLRALPYVEGWAAKYKDAGLVVIGVHTPEFAFEKERSNVEQAVRDLKITYPVAIDSNYKIWQAFHNEYWPAHYFIDGQGRIRYHHFGEGEYDESERVIQELLKDNGAKSLADGTINVSATGAEAAPDLADTRSPETYVGYKRAEHFASAQLFAQDTRMAYTPFPRLTLNQWALGGSWKVGPESAVLETAPGKIIYRFHARDLHLVLGPTKTGKPIRFKVTLDGTAPGGDHGSDTDASGAGTVQGHRLYQLIRQKGPVEDRTFEIEFQDPGVQAFAFTFG